jgi:hypothetical protein
MRTALALVLLVGLVGSGGALAARGDPQERLTAADQARARSILVRGADMNAAFRAIPTADNPNTPYCAALDESDLTVTGRASSPSFTSTAEFVVSRAYLYESRADANASWSRGTSAAGQSCLRQAMRGELLGTNVRLVSFRRIAFPQVAGRSVAYRIIASREGLRLYLDLIALQQGRAQVSIVYGTVLAAPPASEERRLARLVATRMAKAMRGM